MSARLENHYMAEATSNGNSEIVEEDMAGKVACLPVEDECR